MTVRLNFRVSPDVGRIVKPEDNPIEITGTIGSVHEIEVSATSLVANYYFSYWKTGDNVEVVRRNSSSTKIRYTITSLSEDYITAVFTKHDEGHDEPVSGDATIIVSTSSTPINGGSTNPPSSTKYGLPPNYARFSIEANPAQGFAFEHWTLDGSIVSRSETTSVTHAFPIGDTTKRFDYLASFRPYTYLVTVYADGVKIGEERVKYSPGGSIAGPFVAERKDIPKDKVFAGWSGMDSQGHTYSGRSSRYSFNVILTEIPTNDDYPVTVQLYSSLDDKTWGGGDSPDPNDPRPWVWVITNPDDAAHGSTSPSSECHHGTGGSETYFTITATASVGWVFDHWLDGDGKEYSKNQTESITFTFPESGGKTYTFTAVFKKAAEHTTSVKAWIAFLQNRYTHAPLGPTYGGLGKIACGTDSATRSDTNSYPIKTNILTCRWSEDEDGNPIFTEPSVSVDGWTATPLKGFYFVKWVGVWLADDAEAGHVRGEVFDITTDETLSFSIASEWIYWNGHDDEPERAGYAIAFYAVFQPLLAVPALPLETDFYGFHCETRGIAKDTYARFSNVQYFKPGEVVDFEVSFTRTGPSGGLFYLGRFFTLSVDQHIKEDHSRLFLKNFKTKCGGRFKKLTVQFRREVDTPPLADYGYNTTLSSEPIPEFFWDFINCRLVIAPEHGLPLFSGTKLGNLLIEPTTDNVLADF